MYYAHHKHDTKTWTLEVQRQQGQLFTHTIMLHNEMRGKPMKPTGLIPSKFKIRHIHTQNHCLKYGKHFVFIYHMQFLHQYVV